MFSIRLKPFAQRFKKSIFDKNFSMRTLANQDFSNRRAVVKEHNFIMRKISMGFVGFFNHEYIKYEGAGTVEFLVDKH
ncbi:MAG: hypothetical protein ACPH28_00795, partial [Flavobacteriaceae bacterium]